MKNLQVNKVLPVINANFEEVKVSLIETMEKYKGIVVTEDGLKDCKATQKDLAKIRNDIDTYRKLIKKEMTAPITEFENKCKELIALVKETETPILEGIAIYDEKRRQEKIDYILDNITIAVNEVGLNEKYAARLNVNDIKFTLNTSLKSIREDINEKAKNLKALQIAEEEKIKSDISIIETTLASGAFISSGIATSFSLVSFSTLSKVFFAVVSINLLSLFIACITPFKGIPFLYLSI